MEVHAFVVFTLTGYGGGFNERENVEYIEREDSDGEYDEVNNINIVVNHFPSYNKKKWGWEGYKHAKKKKGVATKII